MRPGLIERITRKDVPLGVIGLGYVGLPMAATLARAGFSVTGVDIDARRVETINAGQSPIGGEEPGVAELIAEVSAAGRLRATTDHAELASAEIVIICVDTPVDPDTHKPSYQALRGALAALGKVIGPGALVVIESTIAPGTMERVVRPELERASGKRAGQDFFLGHCPERVMPGVLLHNLRKMSRTVGGQTPEVAEAMVALYRSYVESDLDPADLLTAEIVKTAENAYRDVQIAFANELAVICEELGADVFTVRELVNKSPGRAILFPGAGVGGHCIPKDPWLLIANLGDEHRPRLIPAAREINEHMPRHTVELLRDALAERGRALKGARIAVLGYAFREETDDFRDSPSEHLVAELRAQGAVPAIHDPYVPGYTGPLDEAVQGAHAAVVMVAHRPYRQLDLADLGARMELPVLVDGRHVVDAAAARAHGFSYRAIGIGVPSAATTAGAKA
jgi:UDP-N-acetyl-D-mannosaminuronic acid dehydrogenase